MADQRKTSGASLRRRAGRQRPQRVIIFAPHFAEYSTRLAQAMAEHVQVLLILCRADRRARLDPEWFRHARARLKVFEFRDSRRVWLALYSIAILARAILYRPDIVHMQEQADVITSRVARVMRLFCKVVLTIHDPTPHSGADTEFLLHGRQLWKDQISSTCMARSVHASSRRSTPAARSWMRRMA